MIIWTPERVAELTRLWTEGLSAHDIAELLGGTSKAISTKASKLKLPSRVIIPDTIWTPELTKRALDMWRQWYSAGRIAMEIGEGLTRNAVMGKLAREGALKRGPKPQHRVTLQSDGPRMKAAPLPPDEPLPGAVLVSLMDLERDMCRWPFGDPKRAGFGFCGCKTAAGASYCPTHMERSINPSAPRARKPQNTFPRRPQLRRQTEEFLGLS